jgi:hypothetical protein
MKLTSPSPEGRAFKRSVMRCNAWKVQAGLLTMRKLRKWARNAARHFTKSSAAQQQRGDRRFY